MTLVSSNTHPISFSADSDLWKRSNLAEHSFALGKIIGVLEGCASRYNLPNHRLHDIHRSRPEEIMPLTVAISTRNLGLLRRSPSDLNT